MKLKMQPIIALISPHMHPKVKSGVAIMLEKSEIVEICENTAEENGRVDMFDASVREQG